MTLFCRETLKYGTFLSRNVKIRAMSRKNGINYATSWLRIFFSPGERVPHTCTNMYTCCCQIRRRSSWEDPTRSERLSDCLTSSFYNFLILCCQIPLGTILRLPEVHILVVRFPDPPQKTLPAKWYNSGWSGWSENVHKKWFEDIFSQIEHVSQIGQRSWYEE